MSGGLLPLGGTGRPAGLAEGRGAPLLCPWALSAGAWTTKLPLIVREGAGPAGGASLPSKGLVPWLFHGAGGDGGNRVLFGRPGLFFPCGEHLAGLKAPVPGCGAWPCAGCWWAGLETRGCLGVGTVTVSPAAADSSTLCPSCTVWVLLDSAAWVLVWSLEEACALWGAGKAQRLQDPGRLRVLRSVLTGCLELPFLQLSWTLRMGLSGWLVARGLPSVVPTACSVCADPQGGWGCGKSLSRDTLSPPHGRLLCPAPRAFSRRIILPTGVHLCTSKKKKKAVLKNLFPFCLTGLGRGSVACKRLSFAMCSICWNLVRSLPGRGGRMEAVAVPSTLGSPGRPRRANLLPSHSEVRPHPCG